MTELLRVDCDCGNQLALCGSVGWAVHFDGFPMFTCPCGKKHGLKIAPANIVEDEQLRTTTVCQNAADTKVGDE